MNYQEYVKELASFFNENSDKVRGILNELNKVYHDLTLSDGEVFLKDFFLELVNETYSLNIDLEDNSNYKLILPALRKRIDILMSELKQDKLILESIESDFREKIASIPLFLLVLLTHKYEGNEENIGTILVRLLESNYKNENDDELWQYSLLQEYEKQLYEFYLRGDMEAFRKVAQEYFDYFLELDFIKEVINRNNLKADNLKNNFDALIERMILRVVAQRIEMPKMVSNIMRRGVVSLISFLDSEMEAYSVTMRKINPFSDWSDPRIKTVAAQILEEDYKRYNCSSQPELLAKLISLKVFSQVDKDRLLITRDSYSNRGMINTSYNLPVLAVSFRETECDMYWQYLIMTGIKINGISVKNEYGTNEFELQTLEKAMALLIQNDFTVNTSDRKTFIDLYREYISSYLNYFKDRLNDKEFSVEELVDIAVKRMSNYINNARNFLDSHKKEAITTSKMREEKTVDPLKEYILNGKVIKVTTIEEFDRLLSEANLPKHIKEDFRKQMVNLINRIKQEEYEREFNRIKVEILGESRELFEAAKKSSNLEILNVVSDIEALIELLISANPEESEELKGISVHYIETLEELMTPKDTTHFIPQVVYFKDIDLVPYFLRSIENTKKSNYKDIYNAVNKILEGNLTGDKDFRLDNLPVKFYYKGKNFKIFYAVFGGIIIIIDGGTTDRKFAEITRLVNTQEFLDFLKQLEMKKTVDESDYTEMMMNELKKSNVVRKQLIFQK